MFNSTILDVAIGLVFVYLLLSLMCSAANELIELLLKKRAIDLERGIRELLAPGSDSGSPDVVKALYNHPLVNSLFGGKYEESRIENTAKRKLFRTALPSYIPARTFALALMDLVLPGVSAPPAGGAAPAGGPPAPPARPSGTAGATPPPPNFEVTLATVPPPPLPVTNPANPLTPLRDAIGTNPLLTEHAKVALTSLLDAAGSDVAKARENIETWFNTSMDRVSSWYKRRTQVVILIVGLFVTVAINADTITMVRKLSTDKALRESLVAAAQEYAKANASPEPAATSSPTPPGAEKPKTSPAGGTPGASSSPSPAAAVSESPAASPTVAKPSPSAAASPAVSPASSVAISPAASPTASPSAIPECVNDPDSAACRHAKLLSTIPECKKDIHSLECRNEAAFQMIPACTKKEDRNSASCKYAFNQQQIEALGLPLGWSSLDDAQRKWPGSNLSGEGGWWDQIYWHFLGWLLTAIAISLGAPFWFDLLNKFIVIRSAVKPHEKSPEEKSKG
jgi:hypothetical protein